MSEKTKITKIDFDNAKFSAEPVVFDEYDPSRVDFEQTWRIHLLDLLAPYCEHDKLLTEKTVLGFKASELWQMIMDRCSQWEKEQGF